MRLVIMSTGTFAAPMLAALAASSHEVALLVTRPPRSERGHRRPPPNPSAEAAAARGLEVWSPDSINEPEACARLGGLAADLLVVCDYGELLKPRVLEQARLGGINLHASLLPKYRGAAPINWAIYHGERETGNTVFQLTPGMDSGPILSQCRTPIGPEETAVELKERLSQLGAALVLQTVDDMEAGRTVASPQDTALASRAPRLTKNDGVVLWSRTAAEIKNQVRALQPWPTTFTFLDRAAGEPLRLILDAVKIAPADQVVADVGSQRQPPPAPGQIVVADSRLIVATGEGFLELARVQPAGKRSMPAADLLRGHAIRAGDRLGPQA